MEEYIKTFQCTRTQPPPPPFPISLSPHTHTVFVILLFLFIYYSFFGEILVILLITTASRKYTNKIYTSSKIQLYPLYNAYVYMNTSIHYKK